MKSRTTKVLLSLLASMLVGSVALLLMQSEPIRLGNLYAASDPAVDATQSVFNTRTPLMRDKWQGIVVHSRAEGGDIARRCHFLVLSTPDKGRFVVATDLWDRQVDGRHVMGARGNFGENTVGVCLVGDFDKTEPDALQMSALASLVQTLQTECGIHQDRVYLNRDIVGGDSPGKAFPADRFSALLLDMK